MKVILRSKQGCWTCKLRRKKCNERHPVCSTCESLSINCYGYGAKPVWMDGGEKEKEVAEDIKNTVKKTARRRGRLGVVLDRLHGHQVIIAPKPGGAPEAQLSPVSDSSRTAKDIGDSHIDLTNESIETTPQTLFGKREADEDFEQWSSPAIPNDETALLVHFLDHVLPLQYPMYRPPVSEGGRGWMVSLLLRTPPLFHASLALAAYHRRVIALSERRELSHAISAVEEEKHLTISLTKSRLAVAKLGLWFKRTMCPKNGVGFLASMIQLVFFELYAGDGSSWKIHLHAATGMFLKTFWQQLRASGIRVPQEYQAGKNGALAPDSELPPPEDMVIFRFFCGALLWLDIISSVTIGASPRLESIFPYVDSKTDTKMEKIMGCKNWVMFQLGRVSTLHEDIETALKVGFGNFAELEARANDIKQELQRGHAAESLGSLGISHAVQPEPHDLVTQLFALTVTIYLHLVLHGFEVATQELTQTYKEAMRILRTPVIQGLTSAIVCPLFLVGCVATGEDEDFFRTFLSSTSGLDMSLKHRQDILPLLEEIWQRRGSIKILTWQDALNMSKEDLLLL